MKKIDNLHLGERDTSWGAEEGSFDIEKRILDKYEPHHTTITEWKLIAILQELEDKINEIIDTLNKI